TRRSAPTRAVPYRSPARALRRRAARTARRTLPRAGSVPPGTHSCPDAAMRPTDLLPRLGRNTTTASGPAQSAFLSAVGPGHRPVPGTGTEAGTSKYAGNGAVLALHRPGRTVRQRIARRVSAALGETGG